MKTPVTLLLSAVAGISSCAFAQNFQWGRPVYGDNPTELYPQSICMEPSGNAFFSTGYSSGTGHFDFPDDLIVLTESDYSFYLAKVASDGQTQWARAFSCTGDAISSSVAVDAAGNCYFLGSFHGTLDADPGVGYLPFTSIGSNTERFLAKLDPAGELVWAQSLGTAPSYYEGGAICVSGNAVYCTGAFSGEVDFDNSTDDFLLTATDFGDIFILKLDTDGAFQWAVQAGANDNTFEEHEKTLDIQVDAAGDVFVTGIFYHEGDFNTGPGITNLTPQGDADAFILKVDSGGNFQWAIRNGNQNTEINSRIAIGPDGSVYQCGTTTEESAGASDEDIFVARYDDAGTEMWSHQIGGNGTHMEQGITIDTDETGAVYVGGDFSSEEVDFDPGTGQAMLYTDNGFPTAYFMKLSSGGDFVWAESLDYSVISSVYGLQYDGNGALYATGFFFQTLDVDPGEESFLLASLNNNSNVYFVKLDTAAIVDVTGIGETAEIPFKLYPNPAGESVSLEAEGLVPGSVATVYNLPGERVLQQEIVSPGSPLNIAALPAGMYLVELVTANGKGVSRLVKE